MITMILAHKAKGARWEEIKQGGEFGGIGKG